MAKNAPQNKCTGAKDPKGRAPCYLINTLWHRAIPTRDLAALKMIG